MPVPDATLTALTWMRDDYRELVRSATESGLRAGTAGTRWTNRQLLFHMWFGQRIARVFIPLLGVFGRLPRPVSAAYSRLLTVLTRPYDWVNYVAPVAGVRVVGLPRVQRWMDADTEWLLAWASHASDEQLNRGMVVPVTWDPYFREWMTRADVLDWAPQHYAHHRKQLTLTTPEDTRPI